MASGVGAARLEAIPLPAGRPRDGNGKMLGMPAAYPDRNKARHVFAEAVARASREPVPEEWVAVTHLFGQMKTKTFLVGLGTALLARATDARVDPLTLQAYADVSPGMRAYSARGLAHAVLVPEARRAHIDLGLYGDEPLQNNPFTDEPRLHRKLRARHPEELEHLVSACERIRGLAPAAAAAALAAYLRVRMTTRPPLQVPLPSGAAQLPALLAAVDHFVRRHSERGRVGQAFVAAALGLIFANVKTRNVFASSRKRPGDVTVENETRVTLAVEVRQKAVDTATVVNFASTLATAGIPRGIYAALAPTQPPLPASEIAEKAAALGVAFACYGGPTAFLSGVAAFAPDLGLFLAEFPRRFMKTLEEFGVTEQARGEWADEVGSAFDVRAEAGTRLGR